MAQMTAEARSAAARKAAETRRQRKAAGRYALAECGLPVRPASARTITGPGDIAEMTADLGELPQERMVVLLLSTQHEVIDTVTVYQGSIDAISSLRMAEVLRPAIVASAAKMAIVHNHPSGWPQPSAADVATTADMRKACELMGIALLDHVVVGRGGRWVSIRQQQGDWR